LIERIAGLLTAVLEAADPYLLGTSGDPLCLA
jgi:hypothetical protein